MTVIHRLTRALRQALKNETRAEFEERYLAQATTPADFESRVRHLLEVRNRRTRAARLAFVPVAR